MWLTRQVKLAAIRAKAFRKLSIQELTLLRYMMIWVDGRRQKSTRSAKQVNVTPSRLTRHYLILYLNIQ